MDPVMLTLIVAAVLVVSAMVLLTTNTRSPRARRSEVPVRIVNRRNRR